MNQLALVAASGDMLAVFNYNRDLAEWYAEVTRTGWGDLSAETVRQVRATYIPEFWKGIADEIIRAYEAVQENPEGRNAEYDTNGKWLSAQIVIAIMFHPDTGSQIAEAARDGQIGTVELPASADDPIRIGFRGKH